MIELTLGDERAGSRGPWARLELRPEGLRRVHVMGGPGTGKTTLAPMLAAHLSVPVYHLDDVMFDCSTGSKVVRPLAERLDGVRRIASQPGWVTEGPYLGWTDELLHAADAIVWLDLPWHVAVRRVVLRYARIKVAEAVRRPDKAKLLALLRSPVKVLTTLRWAGGYYHRRAPEDAARRDDLDHSHEAAVERLAPYAAKIIRCKHPSEVQALLDALVQRRAAATNRAHKARSKL
jgi:adenylate kinase family enzyme